MMIVFSKETVKCSWSDSQGSSRDYVYVFMYTCIEAAEAENTISIARLSMCVVNETVRMRY